MHRDFRKYLQAARDQGWRCRVEGKHVKLLPKDTTQPMFTVPGSPSDVRAVRNFRAQCRRAGLEV